MSWMIAVVLVILWLLGSMSGYTDYFIHIPLFFAIIFMLIHIEDDCSNHASDHAGKKYLERRRPGRAGNIFAKAFNTLSRKDLARSVKGITPIKNNLTVK
jgi:hypothetical protein